MIRRVYELPEEIVSRIQEYAEGQGIASEVAAVRELLESSLDERETGEDLERRLRPLPLYSALRDACVHPIVETVEKGGGYATITCRDGHSFIIKDSAL